MASSVLLCTLVVLISTIIPGLYSLPAARDNSEGEQTALLDRERRLASGCITDIYVFAHTSTLDTGAGTNDVHNIEFRTSSDMTYTSPLFDQHGNQAANGKGDLWKINLVDHFEVLSTTCIRKTDITYIAIEKNGWLIDSIVTFIKKVDSSDFELLTIDLDTDQWVDGNGNQNVQPGVVQIFELNRV